MNVDEVISIIFVSFDALNKNTNILKVISLSLYVRIV